jgi:aryl-alcohol dehydrogenase-like predicted oxidoreductase
MLKKLLVPGTSLRVSEMALGTVYWGTRTDAAAVEALYDAYREAGGNVIDTAHIYAAWMPNGNGASERAAGAVLKSRGDRRQAVVITKGGHSNEDFYPRPGRFLSPERVRQDIQESLERLGVDTIDLYFLHRDDRRVPVDEVIGMLNEAVAEGWIRYFGASNWSVERMEEANRYAAGLSNAGAINMGFVASQPEFSLAEPNAAEPTGDPALRFLRPKDLAWHARTGLPAFCYSPTAQGYFSTGGEKGAKAYDNATSRARLERVRDLSGRLGFAPGQVALAYVRHQPFPTIPILGTENVKHLHEALGAVAVPLTGEQVRWLAEG